MALLIEGVSELNWIIKQLLCESMSKDEKIKVKRFRSNVIWYYTRFGCLLFSFLSSSDRNTSLDAEKNPREGQVIIFEFGFRGRPNLEIKIPHSKNILFNYITNIIHSHLNVNHNQIHSIFIFHVCFNYFHTFHQTFHNQIHTSSHTHSFTRSLTRLPSALAFPLLARKLQNNNDEISSQIIQHWRWVKDLME
jgi:hypothetical protein